MTIYVVRNLADKSSQYNGGISAPCENCTAKIKEIGIKKIVYIDENNNIINVKTKNYSTNYISTGNKEYMRQGVSLD